MISLEISDNLLSYGGMSCVSCMMIKLYVHFNITVGIAIAILFQLISISIRVWPDYRVDSLYACDD